MPGSARYSSEEREAGDIGQIFGPVLRLVVEEQLVRLLETYKAIGVEE